MPSEYIIETPYGMGKLIKNRNSGKLEIQFEDGSGCGFHQAEAVKEIVRNVARECAEIAASESVGEDPYCCKHNIADAIRKRFGV